MKPVIKFTTGFCAAFIFGWFARSWGYVAQPAPPDRRAFPIPALEAFYENHSRYPIYLNELAGLPLTSGGALNNSPAIVNRSVFYDAYGTKYEYFMGEERKSYVLISAGRDRVVGTDDDIIVAKSP